MILAVFIVSVAFGAETEFQVVSVKLCPAAYRAFVLCYGTAAPASPGIWLHVLFEIIPSFKFARRYPPVIPRYQEEDDKIQQRSQNSYSSHPGSGDKGIHNKKQVQIPHPLHLDRDKEVQIYPLIGIGHGKGQEDGHVNVVGAEKRVAEQSAAAQDRVEQKKRPEPWKSFLRECKH